MVSGEADLFLYVAKRACCVANHAKSGVQVGVRVRNSISDLKIILKSLGEEVLEKSAIPEMSLIYNDVDVDVRN